MFRSVVNTFYYANIRSVVSTFYLAMFWDAIVRLVVGRVITVVVFINILVVLLAVGKKNIDLIRYA